MSLLYYIYFYFLNKAYSVYLFKKLSPSHKSFVINFFYFVIQVINFFVKFKTSQLMYYISFVDIKYIHICIHMLYMYVYISLLKNFKTYIHTYFTKDFKRKEKTLKKRIDFCKLFIIK